MNIARHAGQNSKIEPARAHGRQMDFVVFFKGGSRRNDNCQTRRPKLKNEAWKGPWSPKLVLTYFEGLRKNDVPRTPAKPQN